MVSQFANTKRPQLGMILAVNRGPDSPFTGVPGKVIYIGPRFRSGDYLITLELEGVVKFRDMLVRSIDAFMSECTMSVLPQLPSVLQSADVVQAQAPFKVRMVGN